MRITLEEDLNTPLPALIPVIIGVAAAVGTAAAVAGVTIQGVQHTQLMKQIKKQEEITKLQKKLTEYQLKQFEESEKSKKVEEAMNTLMNLNLNAGRVGMMTRNMTNALTMQRNITATNTMTNIGLGAIQRGSIVGTATPYVNPAYRGSSSSGQSLDLGAGSLRGSAVFEPSYNANV